MFDVGWSELLLIGVVALGALLVLSLLATAWAAARPTDARLVDPEKRNRDIMGATNPANAEPGTIRKELAESIEANINGEDITNKRADALVTKGIGFVPQNYALFRHMSVFENVAFGLRVRPKAMTVAVILAGLLPIMWSTAAGADAMLRRLRMSTADERISRNRPPTPEW